MIPIRTLDSVWTETNRQGATALQHELSYKKAIWIPTPKGKRRKEQTVKMIEFFGDGKFCFHTGFVPRVLCYLDNEHITYKYTTDVYPIEYDEPRLSNIIFRDYQIDLIETGLTHGRGVLQAATASGKSIILAGIISAFTQERILFLVHTVGLVTQFEEHLIKMGFTDVGVWQGRRKEDKRIILGTVQSFKSVVTKFTNTFDVVLIDEVHHVQAIDSKNYGYVIQRLAAPVKLGVTATLPDSDAGRKQLEALIGPVIGHYSIADAANDKVISKPTVYFLDSPEVPTHVLHDASTVPKKKGEVLTKYKIIYFNGIIHNINRNIRIMVEAEKRIERGKSVLIKIVNMQHGVNLMQLADEFNINFTFVHGGTSKDKRETIRQDFNAKKINVIATDVYKEGVDIQSLDTLIVGGGLKSEITTLQNIGRTLRKTKGKTTVEIIDFKDMQHKYLRNHYTARYRVCKQNGWVV